MGSLSPFLKNWVNLVAIIRIGKVRSREFLLMHTFPGSTAATSLHQPVRVPPRGCLLYVSIAVILVGCHVGECKEAV